MHLHQPKYPQSCDYIPDVITFPEFVRCSYAFLVSCPDSLVGCSPPVVQYEGRYDSLIHGLNVAGGICRPEHFILLLKVF